MESKLRATAETLRSAQSWAANQIIQKTYKISRIVTAEPTKPKYQAVPARDIIPGFDFYAVFVFSAKEKLVEFKGFWPAHTIPKDNKGYANVNLWLDKMLAKLPVKPANVEMKQAPPLAKPSKPQPPPEPRYVPRYFDFKANYEITLEEAKTAIKCRVRAMNEEDDPDVEFMKLSSPQSIRHNQISWHIALHSKRVDRQLLKAKELALLKRRLRGCTASVKLELLQQLLPENRKVLRLRKPGTEHHWELGLDGVMRQLADTRDAVDTALEDIVRDDNNHDHSFIELPFEEVPSAAFRDHRLILVKGTAFVDLVYVDKILQLNYGRMMDALPQPDPRQLTDKRMKALVSLWESYVLRLDEDAMQLSSNVPDIENLVKPACISTALAEYPNFENRKLLSSYMARLMQPVGSLMKKWGPAIEHKHGQAAQQKKKEIEREVKSLTVKARHHDFYTCQGLLYKGKCPYFRVGSSPGDAFKACWKDKMPLHGHQQLQLTPTAFTRAHLG